MAHPGLTPLEMFTATLKYEHDGPRIPHDRLIELLRPPPGGAVVAVCSNHGHVGDPAYFKKDKTRPHLTAPGRITREPKGNGTCLQSSLEPIIILPPSDPVINQLLRAGTRPRPYTIKHAPKTGHIQIPGVLLDNWADGYRVLDIWLEFITGEYRRLGLIDPTTTLKCVHESVVLMNFKTCVDPIPPRGLLDLEVLIKLMQHTQPPFPISAMTDDVVNARIVVYFSTPVDPAGTTKSKNRIMMRVFASGRINLLGGHSREHAARIHRYIDDLVRGNADDLIFELPEPDKPDDPAPAPAPAPRPPSPNTIRMAEMQLDELLDEL